MAAILAFLMKPRNLAYLALLGLLVFGGCKLHSHGVESGKAKQLDIDAPIIAAAEKTKKEAEDTLAAHKQAAKEATEKAEKDRAAALLAQQQIINQTQKDLADAQASLARKEGNINALRSIVSQDLGGIRLPGAVVRLWNESLEGRSPGAGELGTALAGSTVGTDNSATEATLFDLLEAGLRNNAEAVSRGLSLQAWRRWDAKNGALFAEHDRKLKEIEDARKSANAGK